MKETINVGGPLLRHYFTAKAYGPVTCDQALADAVRGEASFPQPSPGLLWKADADRLAALARTGSRLLKQFVRSFAGGALLWAELDRPNLVFTQGLPRILDTYYDGLSAGGFRAGIYRGTTPVAGDTYATHGYTEEINYSGNRKTPTWGAASGGSKATSSPMAFAVTGAFTGDGAFLLHRLTANGDTPGDTTSGAGILLGAGAFSGQRVLNSPDTLNVDVTATLS